MSELSTAMKETSRAGTVWGIGLIVLGVLCILAPLIPGIAVAILVAIFLIAAGIGRLIFAFKAESFGRGVLTFLFGGVQILCGVVMLARPLFGLASVTLVLVVYFIADGIMQIWAGFQLKPVRGWGWMLFGGILSFVLAYMIGSDWPVSGQWAIGVLVGVNLMMNGWSMVALGGAGEAISDEVKAAEEA